MKVLGGNVFKINICHPLAVLHVESHARRSDDVVEVSGTLANFPQTGTPRDTIGLQCRSYGQTNGFVRATLVRHHQKCVERIKSTLNTLHGGVK